MKYPATLGAFTVAFALAGFVQAQEYVNACAQSGSARGYCERVGEAIETAIPRIGIAASGGNPVPGTASTLGMRLGSIPRVTVDVRGTMTFIKLPNLDDMQGGPDVNFNARSVDVDASVGIFSGLSIVPTIGGFGSVDLIASAGKVSLPESKGFTGNPGTWAVGTRIGILRESFTAPGISVSGMYRRIGDVPRHNVSNDGSLSIDGISAVSLRAAIGKRIPVIGLGGTAGIGLDRYKADYTMQLADGTLTTTNARGDNSTQTRKSAFVNASWTLLVLNIAGELGWQEGGSTPTGAIEPANKLAKAGYFAGIAVRIAL